MMTFSMDGKIVYDDEEQIPFRFEMKSDFDVVLETKWKIAQRAYSLKR